MSSLKICRICLRTDIELKELSDNLSDFYEELCDYSTDNTATLSCFSCEYILKKCYNFKKHCRKAEKILRNWKKKKAEEKPLHELHQKLPPFKLTNKKNISNSLENIETVEIKNESPINTQHDIKPDHELKNDEHNDQNYDLDQNYNNDEQFHVTELNTSDGQKNCNEQDNCNGQDNFNGLDNYNEHISENDDHQNDDEDDKYLSEFLSTIKVEKEHKTKKKALVKTEVNVEETDEPKTKRKRARKPLTNQHEYETVFDIQLFHSESEVLAEFEQRKHSERYVAAPYKCTVCFTVYKCQKLLDFHMRWHDPSAGEFSCHICHMRFKRYMSVRKHSNDVHYGLFKCKRCPLVTYHKMVMMHHFQKHQGVEFKCKHCNGVYRHSSTYMTHLRTRHRSEHVCVACARTFVSHAGLLVHVKKMHKSTTVQDTGAGSTCAECKLTFASHAVYIVHVLSTPKHKELAATIIGCPECGAQFENKLQVRAHRRKHHPSYNYSAMKHAERNLQNGRREDERVFDCTMKKLQVRAHRRKHHPSYNYSAMKHAERNLQKERREDERVFDCTMCGKSGTHNTWLYRHYQAEHPHVPYEQVYNERRKHLCDECGRSFFTITALREHKHIHTGAKPYSCDKCPAKFRRKTSLKMHLERHLPPARECQHCGKKFVSASNLSNHMRGHTGERRYKCSICGKGFLHSAAMKEHIRGVHHHIRRARKQHALYNV